MGVFIYILFVEAHWPEDGDEVVPVTVPRANFNKERSEKIQNMDMESKTENNFRTEVHPHHTKKPYGFWSGFLRTAKSKLWNIWKFLQFSVRFSVRFKKHEIRTIVL